LNFIHSLDQERSSSYLAWNQPLIEAVHDLDKRRLFDDV